LAKVYVLTSGKGGVGKTTLTANLGTAMALGGERVALIDADIGLKNLDVVMGLENRIVYTLIDVANGKVGVFDALVRHKQIKNLSLLPASQIATKEMISPDEMKKIVDEMRERFDYIFIDCPAGIERGFRNAVAGADEALVVTTPELPAITDADRVIGLLENMGFQDENIHLIVNRFKPHMVRHGDMLNIDDIKSALSIEVIGIVPDSEDIIISTNKGIPLVLTNGKDENVMHKVLQGIVRRLKGEEVPIPKLSELEERKGFLEVLKSLFGRHRNGDD